MTVDVIDTIGKISILRGHAMTEVNVHAHCSLHAKHRRRHRLVTNFSAEAEGVSVDTIIRELTARK
jgi:hypothetical protein